MLPTYHGHRARLRERFTRNGLDGFADHEVVEILLTLAIPRRDVKPIAKALLDRFSTLRGILDASPDELRTVPGIGNMTPVSLRIIRAVSDLYLLQQAEEAVALTSTAALQRFWRSKLGGLSHEVFEVGYLNAGHKLLRNGVERLEDGTIDRAAVYPRRVMEAALRRGAAAVVFAHNHPSGNVQPSTQDRALTRALVDAAGVLQIRVLDHLIISPDAVFSFRQAGLL